MNLAEVESKIALVHDQLDALEVKQLLVFGSVVKGQAKPDSDVDFVVEFKGATTFLGYMNLLELLETTFERKIDLATMRMLHPELRDSILAEARRVA